MRAMTTKIEMKIVMMMKMTVKKKVGNQIKIKYKSNDTKQIF